jgi:hypothetical protein
MRNGDELLAALRRTVQRGLEQKGVPQKDAERCLRKATVETLLKVVRMHDLEVDVYLGSKYGF